MSLLLYANHCVSIAREISLSRLTFGCKLLDTLVVPQSLVRHRRKLLRIGPECQYLYVCVCAHARVCVRVRVCMCAYVSVWVCAYVVCVCLVQFPPTSGMFHDVILPTLRTSVSFSDTQLREHFYTFVVMATQSQLKLRLMYHYLLCQRLLLNARIHSARG